MDAPSSVHAITVGDAGATFFCPPDERVLIAMERGGQSFIPVGCRGGGCGVCRVKVLEGPYVTGPMSRLHVDAVEKEEGYALACRLYPRGSLTLALATSPHCLVPIEAPTAETGRQVNPKT